MIHYDKLYLKVMCMLHIHIYCSNAYGCTVFPSQFMNYFTLQWTVEHGKIAGEKCLCTRVVQFIHNKVNGLQHVVLFLLE